MKRRSLYFRIVGAFSILALFIILGGALGTSGIYVLTHRFDNMSKNQYAIAKTIFSLQEAVLGLKGKALSVMLPEVFSDEVRRRGYVRELEVLDGLLGEGMRRFEGYVVGEGVRRAWG
ncbi:MAG: hypothetical protein N2572_07505, partial [Syntrophales bacterium]|nr:hypothetical protein [Syntrophales bacterium]